ncbi:MAG: thioredoxin [Treponema sp.]|jgi:thioredoxin 1|nr:thioredoxin [Treponema sp.]
MSRGAVITNDNFEAEVLKSPVPVLLDFWAPWCGPCKMIASVLEELAQKYTGRIKIAQVNAEEETDLVAIHGLSSVPALVIYKDGGIFRKRIGALPKPQIEDLFKDII